MSFTKLIECFLLREDKEEQAQHEMKTKHHYRAEHN